jgi:hypothetical protein
VAELVLDESSWPALPEPHAHFLRAAIPRLREEPALVGLAAAGSFVDGRVDVWSDLDLVVVADPAAWPAILGDRQRIAARLGRLLAAFTGEHVGEPRLLVCLYGPPLVHVDLKFVEPAALAQRVEEPMVLWDRTGAVRAGLAVGNAAYPQPDLQWIEDRFWVWVHYSAAKIGRGELLETCDALAILRARVLGPLALRVAGARPAGVRRVEALAPRFAGALRATVATCDAADCVRALRATIALYRELRDAESCVSLHRKSDAEREAVAFFEQVASGG